MYDFIGANGPAGSRRDLAAAERQAVRRSLLLGLLLLAAYLCAVLIFVGEVHATQEAMGFVGP